MDQGGHGVLDTGVVILLARGDRRARRAVERLRDTDYALSVSSVTVAETVRGHGPGDATVNRVLVSLDDVGLISEETARQAGALLGRAGSAATVDALVAAEAIRRAPCILLTTDPDDLRRLLAGYPQVRVRAI